MRRAVLASILALGLAAPVAADVTIKQTTTGKGLGMSGSAASTTRIKGSKMRTRSASASGSPRLVTAIRTCESSAAQSTMIGCPRGP